MELKRFTFEMFRVVQERFFWFHWSLATIRSHNEIALALASSGIASALLEGGRTANSALKFTLNIQSNETPASNTSKNSAIVEVVQQCKLEVGNECMMAHKKSLEALDRTMKDLRNNHNQFGKAIILLAGDFRLPLPVIPTSTPVDEFNASFDRTKYVGEASI